VNQKKSAVLYLFKRKPHRQVTGVIDGFPIVTSYRYLGAIVSQVMSPGQHMSNISRKISYISRKMAPFRHQKDLKFNANFFKVCVTPQYRLIGAMYGSL